MQQAEKSAVLLSPNAKLFPVQDLERRTIVSVKLDDEHQAIFDSLAIYYAGLQKMDADKYKDSADLNDLEDDLNGYNTVLVSVTAAGMRKAKYFDFIYDVSHRKDMILIIYGKDENKLQLTGIHCPVLWMPLDNRFAAAVAAQMVFGGIGVSGKLSRSLGIGFPKGAGVKTLATRLKYTVPEELGINIKSLKEIDAIAQEGIDKKAAPGMVVLAVKNGKVFFRKAYGHHTYDGRVADKITDLFDMASVTKITATTPSVMHLVETGQLNMDSSIGHYIARARKSPMSDIPVREVMLHQAGFVPFINFPKLITPNDFRRDSSVAFPTKVADDYYIRRGFFKDFMWPTMLYSPILTRGKYVYSDISMYVMQAIIEGLTDTTLDKYAYKHFFAPLGMHSTDYLPRYKFPLNTIVPTEDDTSFRGTLLDGYVHDEGAALKGGVAGHAGLFSTATDLAAYYQMLLNKGTYGGRRYFNAGTVTTFTNNESKVSRRGYGFDRVDPDKSKGYPSKLASPHTFGHTGYTGTCVWVDQDRQLVYIFLSNRVNPTRSPMLSRLEIRGRIQDVFNKAIDNIGK